MFFFKKKYSSSIEDMAYTTFVSKMEKSDIEKCFARLFSTEDGKKAIAWLQIITFHRAANGLASDELLRHMEGQRSLLAIILRLIDRGKNPV